MKIETPKTLVLLIVISAIILSTNYESVVHGQDKKQIDNSYNDTDSGIIDELKIITNILKTKLIDLSISLEIASKLPQVVDISNASLIDPQINGIAENMDPEKKSIAKKILNQTEFLSIGFLLNNGDVYFLEPYERQIKLTTNNLAFRDYFQVVNQTKKTYLSDPLISKATGTNIATIATPIMKDNKLVGIIYGTVDFNIYDDFLQSINLEEDTRIIIIGKNGVKIGDSNKNEAASVSNKTFETKDQFLNLTSVKLALEGKLGKTIEKFEGIESQITFIPYEVLQNKRVLLFVQTCEYDKKDLNKCIIYQPNKIIDEKLLIRQLNN